MEEPTDNFSNNKNDDKESEKKSLTESEIPVENTESKPKKSTQFINFEKIKSKIDISYLLIYALFFISLIYYYLGLKGCDNEELCQIDNDEKMLLKRGFQTAYSSVFFTFSIFFLIYSKKNLMHPIIFVLIYTVIFQNTQGNDFLKHGTYNCALFIALSIIIFIYLSGVSYIIKGIMGNIIKKLFSVIIALLLIFPYIFYVLRTKCIKWNYGLGNIEIEYDINLDSCRIINPNKCTIGMFGNLFDLS